MSAHRADLVRLTKVDRSTIESSLRRYLSKSQTKQAATSLVELACKANKMTGNRVLAQAQGVWTRMLQYVGQSECPVKTSSIEALDKIIADKRIELKQEKSPTIK